MRCEKRQMATVTRQDVAICYGFPMVQALCSLCSRYRSLLYSSVKAKFPKSIFRLRVFGTFFPSCFVYVRLVRIGAMTKVVGLSSMAPVTPSTQRQPSGSFCSLASLTTARPGARSMVARRTLLKDCYINCHHVRH